ncbi:c-type cytochrome [Sphingomonas sp.]|uniref:c-type cytochrome n=1 Tax=Sphingomonas sp. TaxID=28214 RepID=UPI002C9FDC97|nr:c-type cytochrome [Sphingomonas sp.]HWK35007.1 c-type cytochrome [Sphingomonas sp.]
MRLAYKIVIGVVAIAGLGTAILYGASEWMIRQTRAAPLPAITADASSAGVAEGARIAAFTGCRDCHYQGHGGVIVDEPLLGRIVAPAFARVIAGRSDGEVARAIRHGVGFDGRALWVMPTQALGRLSDDDLGKVIGWMRTLRPDEEDFTSRMRFGPIARGLIVTGALPSSVRPDTVAERHRDPDPGKFVVETSCGGCHRLFEAVPSDDGKQTVPALAPVGAAYDPAHFRRLLRTGVGMSKADLGMMSDAARSALHELTDAEITAVQAYLRREMANAPPQ